MDTDKRNHYELLGVSENASDEQIREAFREISRIFHPDSKFFTEIIEDDTSPVHSERFIQITNAYQTLRDPERRRQYDEQLKRAIRDWEDASVRDEALWSDSQVSKSRPWAADRFGECRARSFAQRGGTARAATGDSVLSGSGSYMSSLNPLNWLRRIVRS